MAVARGKKHRIYVGKVSIEEIAEKYGTPVYIYDAERIRDNYRRVHRAFSSRVDKLSLHYAIKACNNAAITDLLIREGAGADVASTNEIQLAQLLGLTEKQIVFTGNSLSIDELRNALASGVVINLDNDFDLYRLLEIGIPKAISFRVNPGDVDLSDSELAIGSFAGSQSKFGVHPNKLQQAYLRAKNAGITTFGCHIMAGSCVLDYRFFGQIVERLLDIVGPIVRDLSINLDFVDIGGGLGIPYQDNILALDLNAAAKGVATALNKKCIEYGLQVPRLILEPGRYFVGDAGVLVGRILTKKDDFSLIYGTDISMCTFARTVMYGAHHRMRVDGRIMRDRITAAICGQVCENTDIWETSVELPSSTRVGDLVVVDDAGAYGYSMSYQYNGRLRPAEVMVDGNLHYIIRRRESFEDMIHNMILPKSARARLRKR